FPQGLAIAATGQVWVADTGHDRIVQFAKVPGSPVTGTPGGPSPLLIAGGCLLALAIAGLGWYLVRRGQARGRGATTPDDPADIPPAPASARPELTRRRLLTSATALSGVAAGTAVLPASLRRALPAPLRGPPGGSLRDVARIA